MNLTVFLTAQSSPDFKTPSHLWNQDPFKNLIKAVNHLHGKSCTSPQNVTYYVRDSMDSKNPFLNVIVSRKWWTFRVNLCI